MRRTYVKIFCGLLLVAAAAQALPAEPRTTSEPAKLGRVELEKDPDQFPGRFPFDGILTGFNDMFERMRQQMLYLMTQVPRIGFGTPEGGNTTSVTKIIDGHKVVINETVYSSSDGDDAAAVFKVRVVDIRPDGTEVPPSVSVSTPAGSEAPAAHPGSVESLESSQENEIPADSRSAQPQKRKVNNMELLDGDITNHFDGIETFDYPHNNALETFDEPDNTNLETFDEPDEDNIESFEETDNDVEQFEHEAGPVIDLSNDIYVNQIAAGQGREPHPDVEVFSNPEPPRDLSRDIFINEFANQFGRPHNPDAEIFAPMFHYSELGRNLDRDTYINEIAHGNVPINPDAEFLENFPSPSNRYYYRTDNS